MSVVPTSIPNVFAHSLTLSLVEQFCSCPAAKALANSADKPLYIFPTADPQPSLIRTLEKDRTVLSKINIPTNHLNSHRALTSLAFEIFNAQSANSPWIEGAENEDIGMDDFARKSEVKEIEETKKSQELIKKCMKPWKLPPLKELEIRSFPDMDTALFVQELECHTDAVRQKWIDRFQKGYCKKHPEDIRSCKTRKEDLCDFLMLRRLPKSERDNVRFDRFCKLYPKAPDSVQNSISYKNSFELCGTQEDQTPTLLASIAAKAVGLAALILGLRSLLRR